MEIRRVTSDADRLRVLEVGREATSRSQPLAYYQALRLKVPRRHEGTWWLLEEEGRALSSLMCYPLRFAVGGEEAPGYGLGAVATRPEARRAGRAAALCRAAIEAAEDEGRAVGLLFSAIPPAYYERLGFVALPAWRHRCRDVPALAASGSRSALVPIDPRGHVDALVAAYRRCHRGLHLLRDPIEWRASLERNASDLFFGVGDGYVRLDLYEPAGIEVVECMVPPDEVAAGLRGVAALAADLDREVLGGWFDPVPGLDGHFEDRGRAATLPMVRGTDALQAARFWGSDYF